MSKDPTWEHCTKVDPSNNQKLRCNYCGKVVPCGVFRMKQHLGRTNKDCAPCLSNPEEVYLKFKKIMTDKIVAKVTSRREQDAPLFEEDDVEVVGDKRKTTTLEGYGVSKKQNTLNEVWKKTDRDKCCVKICRFIYTNALPFNLVNSPTFKDMIEEVSKFGSGLKPPSYHETRNTYLKREVEAVNEKLEKYKKEWKKTGCSIMSDGWTDGKGRSITNFLVNSPMGTVFLKSVDTSAIIHNGEHLFTMLDGIVEEVGEENVVQVITDCASAYVRAGKLLMEKRQHLYWSPCGAHVIDNMLEDIGNMPLLLETVKKAKKITVYIYSHTWVLNLMREHTNNKELARPAITRFATNYLTLQSILDNRQPLRSMFTSKAWEESTYSKTPEAIEVMSTILGDRKFWPGVKYTINVTAPLVRVLRLCDSDDRPSVGYIYEAMDQAKEKIAKNLGGVARRYEKVWDLIDGRWSTQLHTRLHAAAYFLNPHFHLSDNFKADEEICDGYYDVIERLVPLRSERRLIDAQLDKFKRSEGSFGRESAVDARTTKQPALWWESFGNHCPNLQRVAIRILSLVSSATGCERYWSTFEQLVTATGATRNQIFVGDISTFYKNKSTTLNVKVDTCSNVSTSVTVNGISPSTAASLSFKIPDHKSGNQKRERSIYRITLISTMKLGYLKCCTKVGVMSQSNKRQQFGRVDGTYQLDAQYLHPHAMINSSISLTPSPRLEFAGAIGSKEFSLGGEVGFDASTASFTKYNAGVGLNKPDLSAALMVIGKGGAMTFSFIQKVNPIGATIGAEMTHNLRTHENTCTFGSSYAVDPSTLVKARISHNGKFGMVWQRGWRSKSLITFATEYDSKTMNALPRLGLTLALSP